MQRIKRFIATILVLSVIALVWLCLFAGTPTTDSKTMKVFLPSIKLYSAPDVNGGIVFEAIPQGAEVLTVGEPFFVDEYCWQKVEYTSYTGYVLYYYIYDSKEISRIEYTSVKVRSDAMGKKIPLYASHSEQSEVVGHAVDGELLNKMENGIDYGEFSAVAYGDRVVFISNSYLTRGLSYNQLLAVIISSCIAFVITVYVIVLILMKKRAKQKS